MSKTARNLQEFIATPYRYEKIDVRHARLKDEEAVKLGQALEQNKKVKEIARGYSYRA